jgi:hypothetical protein
MKWKAKTGRKFVIAAVNGQIALTGHCKQYSSSWKVKRVNVLVIQV